MNELHCDLCDHYWPLPMELPALLNDFVKALKTSRCPNCDSTTEHHALSFGRPQPIKDIHA